ncbi:MAG: methyltransferase domain-containing protein [Gammaproteobacteria bacterium]|nr:methyltransferase domain-containing protein [Gammaproteobacteria bacterium]
MKKDNCDNNNQEIVPKARVSAHRAILSWFSGRKNKGLILDAPAGFGHLSMRLKEMGFDVICGEIDTKIFKLESVKCIYTDLNEKIDSPNDTFDYICCVDGLEHMTNPYKAVQEFVRVLKPGGYGIFSIPNYSNIEKRAQFFFSGYLTKPKSFDDYLKQGRNLFDFHNTPLTITLINLIFEINGLKVEEIIKDKVKWKQYFWLPLVILLKLLAYFQSEKKWKKYRYDLTLKDEVILGGNTLIFITQKKRSFSKISIMS